MGESQVATACKTLWVDFLKRPIDESPNYRFEGLFINGIIASLKNWYFVAPWYDVYDLVQFIAEIDEEVEVGFIENCNRVLEREGSGYRIINGYLTQITSELEIQEIESALKNNNKWVSVSTHLNSALDQLSDRKNPDYRNSIKESISAVEAACIIMTGDSSATLGKALSLIEKSHSLHGALRSAFASLYGYTSDSGGIRHALLEEDIKVEFEEAKLLLVLCSAFINYLQAKMAP